MGMKYNWMQNSYLTCLGSTDRMFSREFHCIYRTQPVLFTDASLTGWGASWQDRHLSGQWSLQDANQHINWLELEAIHLAVLQWGPLWINQTARVYCDNSTAVAHIHKQGGTHSISLFNKTLELFHLLDQFRILLIPSHLPGARNLTTVALSPLNSPSPTEWWLPQETLLRLFSALGTPLVNMFAARGTEQGDSNLHFTLPGRQSLGGRRPLHILGRLRSSVRIPSSSHHPQDPPENKGLSRPIMILIASQNLSRLWHPLLLLLSQRPHILLTDMALYQYVPNMRRSQFHREPHLLDLAAWTLSGTSWKNMISQMQS